MVAGILEEVITEGEVDDFLIHRDEDDCIKPITSIETSNTYKLMVTDDSRCNYLCGSKGIEEDMKEQNNKIDYISSTDPSIDYNIVQQEKVDKEIEVDKRDSLSYMNVKSVEEGEEWYRQNFPKVPDELYAIMARWNWGDLQDVTKKSIKNDKKRISKGKKPKSVAMTSKQGKFIVEF
tara:strand:- start:1938 stop:2471 length:534 start_codon:yes stop_codon:yes gene_type:complete